MSGYGAGRRATAWFSGEGVKLLTLKHCLFFIKFNIRFETEADGILVRQRDLLLSYKAKPHPQHRPGLKTLTLVQSGIDEEASVNADQSPVRDMLVCPCF